MKPDEYDCDQIYTALQKGIELIGGLHDFVGQGTRVFVKINHLPPASPAEKGIVTHPVFVEAVLRLLKETGASIMVGDDIESTSRDGFEVSGFRQMCRRVGITLVNLKEAGFVEVECNGYLVKKVYMSRIALDADLIVNLPKLKTHSLTVITGGVKNMYGTIPVGLRTRLHGQYMRREDFSQVLIDIFSMVKPGLTIMDGIVAMEGEGPASGNLRTLGIILASNDAVAIDAIATKIVGLDPMAVYTTRYASERGLGIGDLDNIKVVGGKLKDVIASDFRLPTGATNVLTERLSRFMSSYFLGQFSAQPRVVESKCTGCFECITICPTSAIIKSNVKARITRDKCITCMCCHEVCRYGAIIPKRSAIGNILNLLASMWRKSMAAR